MQYFVYILASKRNGTLYTGITGDLVKRVYEHKTKATSGFTNKYNIDQLVYFEMHTDVEQAIMREKRIKSWKRSWKIEMIEKENPAWRDLYEDIAA